MFKRKIQSFAAMHSELANENVIEKYSDGKQDQISFVCDENGNQLKDANDTAYLKNQLQTNGIVLTKLQITQWSPNIFEQTQNSIINIFYLGQKPVLGQQTILDSKISDKKNEQSLENNLTSANNSVEPINSISKSTMNYNSINNNNDTIDYPNYHINNAYVSSDAHSLEYNHEYNDQNPYHTQLPIDETNNNGFNHDDSTKAAVKELFLPIMLSAFGNLGAGIILDSAQKFKVFLQIPQLIVLVPALLGLKGNVEMTLSSRLGTCANLGELEDKKKRKSIVIGNVSLAQCQASTVGLIAPFIAIAFSYIQFEQKDQNDLTLSKTLLILAAAVMTSGLADLMLSSFMCFIVIFSVTKLKINADNIATPIAASVGDLATMSLFAIISRYLYAYSSKYSWLPVIPICIWICIIFFTAFVARRNPHTSKLIYTGWCTLLIAMMIQNTSGSVMEVFFRRFSKMAAFQPLINGFGGNLVAVQSSRIATYLHKTCKKRQLPSSDPRWLVNPFTMFLKSKHGKLALILVLMAAPLQFPFIFMIRYITDSAVITPAFLVTYYVCCTVQVSMMLYVGYVFVHLLWKMGFNPDNNAIPILTALADLTGSALFAIGFSFLRSLNDPNAFNNADSSTNQTLISTLPMNSTVTLNPLINLGLSINNLTTMISPIIDTSTISNTVATFLANSTDQTSVLFENTTFSNGLDQMVNSTLL